MTIEGMNHFTVLTDDVPKTVGFYGSVLGLVPGERPNLNFPGAWLYAQGQAILHIVGGRPQEALRPGVIDHIAFSGRGLAATLQNLTAHQVEYICRRQVGSGVWQVFFFDPNGARVELDFDAEESDRA